MQFSNRATRWAAWLACILLLLARSWRRLAWPDLVVEDGFIFFRDAITSGYGSLFEPYAHSFHTIQRLFMLLIVHLLPLAATPLVVCLLTIAITAFVFSKVVGKQYEWILPDSRVRWATALVFCAVPGMEEMAGSFAHLNWILMVWLGLLGLQDLKVKITVPQIIGVQIICYSVAMTILLVPLFVWRLGMQLRAGKSRDVVGREAAVLGLILISIVHLLLIRAPRGTEHFIPSWNTLNLFQANVFRVFTFQTWLGNHLTLVLAASSLKFWRGLIQIASLLFILGWFLRKRNQPYTFPLFLFVAGITAWIPLNWMARPESSSQPVWSNYPFIVESHWSFPVGFVALVFWMVVLSRAKKPVRTVGPMLFTLVCTIHLIPRFFVAAHGMEHGWPKFIQQLDRSIKTGCPKEVQVLIQPSAHNFTYTSAKDRECGRIKSSGSREHK